MAKDIGKRLLDELTLLEQYLKGIDCWDQEPPSPEALKSSMPFCVDTLTFPQWVQFIFIVRMRVMVNEGGNLPYGCNIAPIAEEYFRHRQDIGNSVVEAFCKIDQLLNT